MGYFYNAPPLGVAYCLAKPRMALMQRQPVNFPRLSASVLTSVQLIS